MLALKPFITTLVALPDSDWADMALSLKAIKAVAVATDRVQSDFATLGTVKEEMQKIRSHFEQVLFFSKGSLYGYFMQIASIPGLEGFSKSALDLCDARWIKHFDHDAAILTEVNTKTMHVSLSLLTVRRPQG